MCAAAINLTLLWLAVSVHSLVLGLGLYRLLAMGLGLTKLTQP